MKATNMTNLTFVSVRDTLKQQNMVIRKVNGEYRVAFAGPNQEESAYYTDDLRDAMETGLNMASKKRGYSN